MPSADAVARETAWLSAYSPTDGLPALPTTLGGPFDVVQAYWPRTPLTRTNQLYVRRTRIRVERFGFNRKQDHHEFQLRIIWPLSSSTGAWEPVQQALDDAVDLVLQRVTGPINALPLDKTHGARFLEVAEDPCLINVEFSDPEQAAATAALEATITYEAADIDYTG
jgi:hypothetical protein